MANSLVVVFVHVHVLPQHIEAFRAATLANARESVKEPGVARFDVVQETEDPTRFVLIEAYRGQVSAVAHKETAHYKSWRDTVADMMAEPRSSKKYVNVTEDTAW